MNKNNLNGTVISPNARPKCPYCKRGRLYDAVPKGSFVKTFLFFLPLKRYKCHYCGRHPYTFSKNA